MATFGQRLREIRTANNLTQKDFAKLFKVSESAIGMYERDEREPSYKLANEIADKFEVSTDYLFGRTDDPKPFKPSLSFFGGPNDWTEEEFKAADDFIKEVREARRKALEKANKEE